MATPRKQATGSFSREKTGKNLNAKPISSSSFLLTVFSWNFHSRRRWPVIFPFHTSSIAYGLNWSPATVKINFVSFSTHKYKVFYYYLEGRKWLFRFLATRARSKSSRNNTAECDWVLQDFRLIFDCTVPLCLSIQNWITFVRLGKDLKRKGYTR